MHVKCPACNASFALEAALAVDAGRSALVVALEMLPAPLGRLLVSYLGMFRAGGRALNFDRVERLLAEIKPMLESLTVMRNGVTRPCPHAVLEQALLRMIEQRDTGKLQLPLKSHGYLLEIVFGLADQADAKIERKTEATVRRGDHRNENEDRLRRSMIINQVRGDIDLGLIDRDAGIKTLRDAGINPEVL